MPYYEKEGKSISFSACKKHVSFFAGVEAIEKFSGELNGFVTKKNAIYFPYDRALPGKLIENIVKWCLSWFENFHLLVEDSVHESNISNIASRFRLAVLLLALTSWVWRSFSCSEKWSHTKQEITCYTGGVAGAYSTYQMDVQIPHRLHTQV